MKTTLRNLKQVGLLAITASSLLLIAKPSQALNLNLSTGVNNSSFTKIGTNGQVNTVPGTNGIDNNVTASRGFSNFFENNDFLLLGAQTTKSSILFDGNLDDNSVARSAVFSLDRANFQNGIDIKFNWAFNGNSTGNLSDLDNFSIGLFKSDLSNSATVFQRNAPGQYGSGSQALSLSRANFNTSPTPGRYFLQIALQENAGNTRSSAAGFNNISIVSDSTPVAAVPFEFSPSQGLLAIGGFWSISAFIKRRKSNTSNLDLT
jgi:hypothetical protein